MNLQKLHAALEQAGLPICGIDQNMTISWATTPTPQQLAGAQDIIRTFDPNKPLQSEVKAMRSKLLTATDWVVLPDNSLSEEQKIEWIVWRAKLRDWKRPEQDCPIPPNEYEYCLLELWDAINHKPYWGVSESEINIMGL